jgi:uncharacterized protein (TIGR02996 family)
MDSIAHLKAIRQDPDDNRLRLAFADWLENNHQPERAAWIRAGCDPGLDSDDDEVRSACRDRRAETFARCRPAWWEDITGADQTDDRGMFRFRLGTSRSTRNPTAFKRFGKTPWLGTAYDEGWLHRVEFAFIDGELANVVAAWKEPVSSIPLFARPAPQCDDDDLRVVLDLPQLEGLRLDAHVLRNSLAHQLARFPKVVDLVIEFRLVDDAWVDLMLEQILGLTGLRRLHLIGHDRIEYGKRPNDADVLRLRKAPALKRLFVSDAPAVTDEALAEFRRTRPTTTVERVDAPY